MKGMNKMTEQVIIAGFGGQGVMSIGQILTYAGMTENKEVSWLPSYGPEMRGGTANCNVIVSTKPIASPIVTGATAALVLNKPSLEKFEKAVKADGHILINSSLIDKKAKREDINAHYIPANEIAIELGNTRIANMVMLGAYLELTHVVSIESVAKGLEKVLGKEKEHLVEINIEAMKRGAACVA